MADPRIIVHIGFHKTGTSSIQTFLDDSRDQLADRGVFYYTGQFAASNHVELHCAAMRATRESPFKVRNGIRPSAAFLTSVGRRIDRFLLTAGTFVFSSEGISYLRHRDELETLHRIFGGRDIEIVAYVRNRKDWMDSYRAEIARQPAARSPPDDSYANTTPDSWLLDFDARLNPFQQAFGRVHVIDYDQVLANDGSVIPSFFRVTGAEDFLAGRSDWPKYWKNRRSVASLT